MALSSHEQVPSIQKKPHGLTGRRNAAKFGDARCARLDLTLPVSVIERLRATGDAARAVAEAFGWRDRVTAAPRTPDIER